MTDKLVLAVDGSNWVHRAWHTPSTKPNHAAVIFCDMLTKVERTFGPSHLFVAFDHQDPCWRHKLWPQYKADRPAKDAGLVRDLELAEQAARTFGCQVFRVPGCEADDVLATIATRAFSAGINVLLGSSDKDLQQLCFKGVMGNAIRALKPATNGRYDIIGPAEVEARWGVGPARLRDVLALMGDSADNIPGVDGIGPATAAELVRTYGSALAAVDHADDVGGKRGAALGASRATVELCLELVRLKTDVDLGCQLRATPLNHDALAAFKAQLEHPDASKSYKCDGVCGGVPGWEHPVTHFHCSNCGGSGKVTTYNQRLLDAQQWDEMKRKKE